MGMMALWGLQIIIIIVIALIFLIISLLFGHIIIFDSIILGIVGGISSHVFLQLHPAIALLIGVAIFAFFIWIQHTTIGFWLISGLLSVLWGGICSYLAYNISGKDMLWTYVVWGLGVLIFMGLHGISRMRMNEV